MDSPLHASYEAAPEPPKARRASLLSRLSIAHFVAIVLLALLTLGSYLVLRDATVRLTDTGTILTASRQRWVAQRVSLLALQLIVASDDLERDRLRDAIRDQLVNLESGLNLLISGQLEPNHQISPALSAILFEPPFRVQHYTQGVIDAARELIEAPSEGLIRQNDDLQRLLAMNSLLTPGLDRIVVQSRNERWDAIGSLETLQLALMLGTLLGLVGIFVMLFLPMQRQIRDESRQMLSEIEERKRAQQALLESEQRYRSLFAALSEGVVMQDMTSRIVTCNQSAERILGLTRHQMIGLSSYDSTWRAIHEDGSPFPGEEHPAVKTIRTGKAFSDEIMGVHKPDGTLTWIRINCEPILREGTEEMVGVVCSFADITESKSAQDELRRSRDLLQIVMDNSPDSIFIKDMQERFVMVNKAEAQLWGQASPADLVGKNLYDVMPARDVVENIRRDTRDVLEKGIPVLDKLQTFTAVDGTERWFSTTMVPLRDEHGEVNGLLGIARDITERRRSEAQAQELERERDKVEVLSDLMRDTSHELRTPLSIINTSLYLIKRESSPEKRAERIAIVEQQVRHLTMLLEQMHNMSVLDNSGEFSMMALDIRHLLDEVGASAGQHAEDQGKRLHINIEDGLPTVDGNERQLRFAVRHLLDNAVHFTHRNGEIWLRAFSEARADHQTTVTIEVRDNGIGIEADELPFIFDRFYKVDKARTLSGSGAGLGLSMVKKIVDIHRGSIEVDSEPGKGSTFRIVLPASTVLMSRS